MALVNMDSMEEVKLGKCQVHIERGERQSGGKKKRHFYQGSSFFLCVKKLRW